MFSLAGAGLAYFGARAGTGQREKQGRREEWGRRFTAALEAVGGIDERQRLFGRVLLVELARSQLATDDERQLAADLLFADTRYNPGNADLRIVNGEQELDRTPFIVDDEVDDRTEGPL